MINSKAVLVTGGTGPLGQACALLKDVANPYQASRFKKIYLQITEARFRPTGTQLIGSFAEGAGK